MVAFLTKTEGNDDFADIVDFLNVSSIRYSLTVNPTVYVSYIKQFWSTAKTKTANNETQIYAKVAGKSVVVTESSVRSDLHFNDEDGATCLTTVEIFENLALMGYERDSDKLSFEKALFSPHWKYLIHTILHCLSSKSTAWNEFSTNVASAVICLAKGQKRGQRLAQANEIAYLKEEESRSGKEEKIKNSSIKLFKIGTPKEEYWISRMPSKNEEELKRKVISEDDDFDDGIMLKEDETSKAKSTVFEDVKESAKEQREGKAPMVEEDVPPPKKTQKQLDDERAGLEEP
ncbi:hypothetical protein Tco_0898074 [Tanacetum coccineum]